MCDFFFFFFGFFFFFSFFFFGALCVEGGCFFFGEKRGGAEGHVACGSYVFLCHRAWILRGFGEYIEKDCAFRFLVGCSISMRTLSGFIVTYDRCTSETILAFFFFFFFFLIFRTHQEKKKLNG